MTDEDRQRQMDFILDQQARLTATVSLIAEAQAIETERARIARLEESFVVLTKLAESYGADRRMPGTEKAQDAPMRSMSLS